MDHIGGLPHLLWTIRKLSNRLKKLPKFNDVTVYCPNRESFGGVMAMLRNAEGHYKTPYKTNYVQMTDGVIFKNDNITVTAKHNFHLPQTEEGYQSFSFLIEACGKKIVYSGDVSSSDELDSLIGDGCDVLLTETGHHKPVELCEHMKNRNIGQLLFLHHGRPILHDYDTIAEQCLKVMPNVTLCNDKDVFEI
jgi:ribonuclease BN (tRNA processing enzyme)